MPASHASTPALYTGTFTISGTPQQTFLQTPRWGKGIVRRWPCSCRGRLKQHTCWQVLVNGFNVGRFTDLGPQCSLYVPQSVLRSGANIVVVFESDSAPVTAPRHIVSSSQQLFFNSSNVCSS